MVGIFEDKGEGMAKKTYRSLEEVMADIAEEALFRQGADTRVITRTHACIGALSIVRRSKATYLVSWRTATLFNSTFWKEVVIQERNKEECYYGIDRDEVSDTLIVPNTDRVTKELLFATLPCLLRNMRCSTETLRKATTWGVCVLIIRRG